MDVKKIENTKIIRSLIEDGSKIDGNPFKSEDVADIPWLDTHLLEKGRDFVKHNYCSFMISFVMSNFIGFAGKQVSAVFFKKFYPENSCGKRFLISAQSFLLWLNSDLESYLNPNSTFMREIKRVQKLHKFYSKPKTAYNVPPEDLNYPKEYTELVKIIKKDLNDIDISSEITTMGLQLNTWKPEAYFTQFDLAVVLYGAIVSFRLFPNSVGIYTEYETDEEMRGYFHMWAVIGRLLGLEDRFNLALQPDKELHNQIFQELGLPYIKELDETVIFQYEMIIKDYNKAIPFVLTTKGVFLTFFENIGQDAIMLRGTMSKRDWISFGIITYIPILMRFKIFKIISNWFVWFVNYICVKLILKKNINH